MRTEVETLVRSATAMDASITEPMLELALAALRGERLVRASDPTETGTCELLTPIVTIKETTKILRCNRGTVNRMMNKRILVRVYGSGTDRAIGVTRESVVRAMRGLVRKYGRRK